MGCRVNILYIDSGLAEDEHIQGYVVEKNICGNANG